MLPVLASYSIGTIQCAWLCRELFLICLANEESKNMLVCFPIDSFLKFPCGFSYFYEQYTKSHHFLFDLLALTKCVPSQGG